MNDKELRALKKEQTAQMNKLLKQQKEAIARFPKLYDSVKGWECGPGWYPLLIELSEKLEPLIEKEEGQEFFPCASQVKEKFGTLHFYMLQETREMTDLIAEYEEKSNTICEECGQEGTLQLKGNWWVIRCGQYVCRMEYPLNDL